MKLLKLASGCFYCPDKYFLMEYEKLPESIKSLISVRILSNNYKK